MIYLAPLITTKFLAARDVLTDAHCDAQNATTMNDAVPEEQECKIETVLQIVAVMSVHCAAAESEDNGRDSATKPDEASD